MTLSCRIHSVSIRSVLLTCECLVTDSHAVFSTFCSIYQEIVTPAEDLRE